MAHIEALITCTNWDEIVNQNFQLNIIFTIKGGVNNEHARGELPDGTECSIWKIRDDFFSYDVVLKYYNQNESSLFKIYGISSRSTDGVYIIVSECVRCSLVEWIASHPPLTNQKPDLNLFLYPLRTLLDSIIAICNNNICPDFELEKKDVFVIQTGNAVKFKVGFILPLERRSKLQCLDSASKIVSSWFSRHGTRIPPNIIFLLNLMTRFKFTDEYHQLKMLRLHPIFYEGDKKEFLFDFVTKVQRLVRNKFNNGGIRYVDISLSLQTAFKYMNIYRQQRGSVVYTTCWEVSADEVSADVSVFRTCIF